MMLLISSLVSKYKDIISEKTYNIENFNKLIEKNNNYKTSWRFINKNEQLKMKTMNIKKKMKINTFSKYSRKM